MTAQQPTPPTAPYDPMFGLQEKIASLLTPIFQDANTNELFAYQIACRSLQAYEPETRADFVNIGRTIAFSLASLVVLKEAFDPALHLEDKKRIASHANALNRSADQAERSMMERRRYQRAYPTFPVPQQPDPPEHEPPEHEPNNAQARTQVAEAVTRGANAQPVPAKPELDLAPPPLQRSASHYYGPDRTNMPPIRPDSPITPAMLHADNPNSHHL